MENDKYSEPFLLNMSEIDEKVADCLHRIFMKVILQEDMFFPDYSKFRLSHEDCLDYLTRVASPDFNLQHAYFLRRQENA